MNRALRRQMARFGAPQQAEELSPDAVLQGGLLDDTLLDDFGRLRVLPVTEIDRLDRQAVRAWCHLRGVYLLPTAELIAWLHERIGERSAIEIGSGNGALGRALGIPRTDSRVQEGAAKAFHEATRQPPVRYGDDVVRLEAAEAVRVHRPQVVVAAWVTHKLPDDAPRRAVGCAFGVCEDQIARRVEEYIMIGNLRVHAEKPLLRQPHEEFRLPFIRSRARDPGADRAWSWTRG